MASVCESQILHLHQYPALFCLFESRARMMEFMDDTPATKADLQKLAISIRERFDIVDGKFERVHEDINRVLDVLVNVDKRLSTRIEDHEVRLVRLEETSV